MFITFIALVVKLRLSTPNKVYDDDGVTYTSKERGDVQRGKGEERGRIQGRGGKRRGGREREWRGPA